MKNLLSKIAIGSIVLATVFSCSKKESLENSAELKEVSTADAAMVSDSVSTAASTKVKDKQFVKTADVDMEVKDVYDATISIEKSLKDLGGFVTVSRLNSNVVSEKTFNTSDENATLVKKYQSENKMQVRVPSDKLGEFLQFINDKKVFLNSRIILAEDVTANIKLAELEAKRNAKTGENITQLKTNTTKVNMSDDNMSEGNQQKVASYQIKDQIEYSTVDIYIKEPKIRVTEIAVTNTKNIDNKYKFNFFYDAKNAVVEGFYLIQKLIIGLLSIWPILLIGFAVYYFVKKRKISFKAQNPETTE